MILSESHESFVVYNIIVLRKALFIVEAIWIQLRNSQVSFTIYSSISKLRISISFFVFDQIDLGQQPHVAINSYK